MKTREFVNPSDTSGQVGIYIEDGSVAAINGVKVAA